MKDYSRALELLEPVSIGPELKGLYDFFNSTIDDFSHFQEQYNIHCPSGCGECCRHFIPDITKLEALLVASYLRFCKEDWEETRRRLELFRDNEFGFCPLFRENTPYHCSVYEARPLICRLFGNCCSEDKEGNAVFRRCKFNYEPEIMAESLRITDEDEKASVPVMDRYGIEMMNLDGNDSDRRLLPEAVLEALDKINYYIQLLGISEEDISPSNPDDNNFPSPQAS
jgi:Uncharacterised protein family (UPF0153).